MRVNQSALSQYAEHQFKDYVSGNTATFEWQGQTDVAPTISPVVLQIYNRNTSTWETIDTDNTSNENVDFTLSANVPDLTDYKDGGSVVSCRVYQLSL